jgi:hypothetical protein
MLKVSSFTPTLRATFVAVMSLALFFTYNFINAAWTAAPANPPNNNAEAPITVGSSTQDKNGNLSVNTLGVFGNFGVTNGYININSSSTGYLKITSPTPYVQFGDTDTGSMLSRILYAQNQFYVQADRNGDNVYDTPNPLIINIATTSDNDYAKFADGVYANAFCDRNGMSCVAASEIRNIIDTDPRDVGGADTGSVNATALNSSQEFDLLTDSNCVHRTSTVQDRKYVACPAGDYVAGVTNASPQLDVLCCPFHPEPHTGRMCYVQFNWKTTIAEYSGDSTRLGSTTAFIAGEATDSFEIGMLVESDYGRVTDNPALEFTYNRKLLNRTGGYAGGGLHKETSVREAEYVSLGYWSVDGYTTSKPTIDALISSTAPLTYREAYAKAVKLTPGTTVNITNTRTHNDDSTAIQSGWESYTAKVIDCN